MTRMLSTVFQPLAALGLLAIGGCTAPPPAAMPAAMQAAAAPEIASPALAPRAAATFGRHAVAAAHPLAADAGLDVLRAGGSAVDAAVAVQMVLALVEPQSSGLGGGAFLLHWDGRAVAAWDGRETAPAGADERLLLRDDGTPLPFAQAVVGGRAVGVPGAVRMIEAAHRAHGRLPWARLFESAIRLSEQGFAVTPRLHAQLAADPALRRDPLAAALYYGADGQPHPVGHVLRNPALAEVLRQIAARGSAALHDGPVAADIAARVQQHPHNPGRLTVADLAGYRVERREPLCTDWRRWRVCGMPPPSSGHLAVMQIIGLLERSASPPGAATEGAEPVQAAHRYVEAARLAWADRAQWVADPAYTAAPAGRWDSLLDDAYLRERAALIGPARQPRVAPGRPGGAPLAAAPMPAQPESGTSHLSIVDADGHAVAMTTTVEAQFGARLMSNGGTGLPGGFLLNNELTDFSFRPIDAQGRRVANRVQPGQRPRSSMSPTLVFDRGSGQLVMSLGSPGGATIIHYVARTLLATLGEGVDADTALSRAHLATFDDTVLLEKGRHPPALGEGLRARGHPVVEVELTSGLQLLRRVPSGWQGAADPRREGAVRGD